MPGGGGLLQLVAQGKQDLFLTGNPQVTWFKMVYRRYTNFAIESQPMYFDGDPDFGKRLTCTIPRRGDLLGPMLLEIVLPRIELTDGTPVSYVNSTGHAIIEEISLEIGEQEIDKQTGEWMEIWSELVTPQSKREGFNNMINKADGVLPPPLSDPIFDFTANTGGTGYQYGSVKLYVPLQFWFNKNPGLYLPLLAMQYHPVRLNVKLRPLQEMFYSPLLGAAPACGGPQVKPVKIIDIRLWGDYVYLDTEERRRFVSNTHEYLIEQIQYTPPISIAADVNTQQVRMEFNHPVRELVWRLQRDKMLTTHEFFNYGSTSFTEVGIQRDMLQDAVVQVDGYDRFERRDAGYFRLVQPYMYHTNIPTKTFLYTYSFSLRPEEMQPTGSINASRIDNMILQVSLRPDFPGPQRLTDGTTNPNFTPPRGTANVRVYAKNHNVLRVVNGFAGLLFKI